MVTITGADVQSEDVGNWFDVSSPERERSLNIPSVFQNTIIHPLILWNLFHRKCIGVKKY